MADVTEPDQRSRQELLSELNALRAEVAFYRDSPLAVANSEKSAVPGFLPIYAFRKDREGRFLAVNPHFAALYGRGIEEIIGCCDFDLVPPDLARKYRDDDQRVMAEGRFFHTVEAHRGGDGHSRTVMVVKYPLRDKDGAVIGVQGAFWHVAPTPSVEQRLEEGEERLRRVLDNMPVLMAAYDDQGTIVCWNHECERVTGYTAAEIVDNPRALALMYPEPGYLDRMLQQAQEFDGDFRAWEWQATCKDGSRRTLAWSSLSRQCPIPGWAGWAVGVDVTENQANVRLLNAIQTVQAEYIARSTPAQVFNRLLEQILLVTDSAHGFIGEVLHAADGAPYLKTHAITNIAWDDTTRRFYEQHAQSGLIFRNLRSLIGAVLSSSQPVIANNPATDPRRGSLPEGHPPLTAFLGVPLFHAEEFVGVVGVANRRRGYDRALIDFGGPLWATCGALLGAYRAEQERQHLELEQRRLQVQLQHAQKLESLGVLAGGIAHDFNNLLVSILGNASLALEDLSPLSPARESICQIETAAVRAAELCKQMLAYSGKGRFVVTPLNLSELVSEMAHLLQVSLSKKVILRYNLHPQLPSVAADATQVRQVVMNLLTNASEACAEKSGLITISTGTVMVDREYLANTWYEEGLPEGTYVYVEVSDTGCGMSEETRARVFDPFFTTKSTGRGLGMAAVLGIVRGHKGAIKCYSEVGKGTTFKVLFPAVNLPAASLAPRPTIVERKGTGTVLVVDDEESVRGFTSRALERQGYKVLIARDGLEAVALFRQRCDEIRLVLLDMTMPHLDGEETFRELRRIREDVRVILTSGYNEQEATNRFVGKGLCGFIQKPYRPSDLLVAVRKALEPNDADPPVGNS